MIQRTECVLQGQSWKNILAQAFRDPNALLDFLHLQQNQLPYPIDCTAKFPMRVPHPFVSRMKRGDPNDPLLRQVLPLQIENEAVSGYNLDPVGDCTATVSSGVLHKYHGRVLIISTSACGIHCRYCFRRHYPYEQANNTYNTWQNTLTYLNSQPHVNELILSGGDPLSLDDERLVSINSILSQAPQIKTLRLHTRMPVVIPQRVTAQLLNWISTSSVKIVIVLHINHGNEIDEPVMQAMQLLTRAGATLLNQSVLLRGVNDNVETLAKLSAALFAANILPYYLHQLDPVQGAAHFQVSDTDAVNLVADLQAILPGYLVPRLVREKIGAKNKTPLP